MTADLHNISSLSFPERLFCYPLHPRNPWKSGSSLSTDLADDRGSAQHLFSVVPRKAVLLSAPSAKSVESSSSLSTDLADDRGSAQHLFSVVPRKAVALSAT